MSAWALRHRACGALTPLEVRQALRFFYAPLWSRQTWPCQGCQTLGPRADFKLEEREERPRPPPAIP